MRTVVVQGGWRVWLALIVGGAVLLALTLTIGVLLLGVIAIGGALLLGQRLLQAVGLGGKRTPMDTPAAGSDTVIDGEFHVVSRDVTIRQLPAPRDHSRE
jgi:hypothetical protein